MSLSSSPVSTSPVGEAVAFDPLDAYRRMFATARDGLAAWWYFGTSFVEIDGYPTLPVIEAETLMVYKTTTLDRDAFRMDWWEIGYMRDPVTGEVADQWKNPITGKVMAAPNRFEEGPAHLLVERVGAGLRVQQVQAHAKIESVEVSFARHGDRLQLTQVERKIRGFPLPDGSMPSLDSEHVSPARTQLALFSGLGDLANDSAASSGAYEFELSTPPPWMGFGDLTGRNVVRGIMAKAPMNDPINAIAWKRLQALFPDRFDGDAVRPRWV